MKLKVADGIAPPKRARRPAGDWITVPDGFREALLTATKFTAHDKIYPWVKYVYLLKGKLYASDNRCIVEIDLADRAFGDTRFTSNEIEILKKWNAEPSKAMFHDDWTAFAWSDDSWCKIERDERIVNFDHATQCCSLIKQFWHEGRSTSGMRAPILIDVKRQGRGKVIKFKGGRLGEPADQLWHGGSIEKVMKIAETFDPDASPAPFSFPNGKGLIAKPGQ